MTTFDTQKETKLEAAKGKVETKSLKQFIENVRIIATAIIIPSGQSSAPVSSSVKYTTKEGFSEIVYVWITNELT